MNTSGSTPQFENASRKAKVLYVKERGVIPPVFWGPKLATAGSWTMAELGQAEKWRIDLSSGWIRSWGEGAD